MGYEDDIMEKLYKQKNHLQELIAFGGTKAPAENKRALKQDELRAGLVKTAQGLDRSLTAEEKRQQKILVNKVFSAAELEAKQQELNELENKFDERKQVVDKLKHAELLKNIADKATDIKNQVTTSASGTERVMKDHVSSGNDEILRRIDELELKLPEPTANAKRQKEADDKKAILLAVDPEAKKAFDEEWARKAAIALTRKHLAETVKKNLKSAEKRKDQAAQTEWKTNQEETEKWLDTLLATERRRQEHEDAKQTWSKTPSKENEKLMVASEMEWQKLERNILEQQKKPFDAVKTRLEGLEARAKQIEIDMKEQKDLQRELEKQEKRGAELRRKLGLDPLPAMAGPESSGKVTKRGGASREPNAKRARRT